ncbi:armadillo-type protein [Neohortaea acidophila]|uniref:Armadillo-type protein n=1 Tax=Neohortaea acidophila TaxID=245834 RepID=A0A6A6Q7E5_9PEZI|nr:armadillo-type protein [Neohortaea acidophila]KAF2488225.1 armadillo-type protein [Neohortaea acidophila]
MENADDDDDLRLAQASAGLIADLELALPKILWKRRRTGDPRGRVHIQVRQRDLDYAIRLLEPFQGEPQLLDARLNQLLPPIVEAFAESLQRERKPAPVSHVDFESAICILLYTFCKVRGHKVISRFLNNEPRYLEPVLSRLEHVLAEREQRPEEWQTPYVLLLWLSHLLLTPFDLSTISNRPVDSEQLNRIIQLPPGLPPIVQRVLFVGHNFLPVSTKAQDAAAMLLLRLVIRVDMQKLQLADAVVSQALGVVRDNSLTTVYEKIGPLRFLAGVGSAAELDHLIPSIYLASQRLAEEKPTIMSSAVAKKLVLKIFRNIAVLALRSTPSQGALLDFVETSGAIETAIDHLLGSLGDGDTPVRYAAAKALSFIIIQLPGEMGHEVIQAILDSFKDSMPHDRDKLDFRAVDALKWHGLTLALAHTLFKRCAIPAQIPEIVDVLVLASQFEQRTATGSSIGTNVRDAANFGIWSLSRRYTTEELLAVKNIRMKKGYASAPDTSVIQWLAIQLILSACLDPAGNIRRGSSAALQELVGRHPNHVHEGIALVQIVDYQAVGLRRRAMLDVASRAAPLNPSYWTALSAALFEWRGLGSSDVESRDAAAASLARLSGLQESSYEAVLMQVLLSVQESSQSDPDYLHGLVQSLAYLLQRANAKDEHVGEFDKARSNDFGRVLDVLLKVTREFSLRMLRSELPAAIVQLLAALCQQLAHLEHDKGLLASIDTLVERMLTRSEETILQAAPSLIRPLLTLKVKLGMPLGCLDVESLCMKVATDSSKSTMHGAGRAIALGALIGASGNALLSEDITKAVSTLGDLTLATNVDWRIVGIKALQLVVESTSGFRDMDTRIPGLVINALHHALNDYTIDERGDVGSLVRLQALQCTTCVLAKGDAVSDSSYLQILHADILRLSLEKLDRVRLAGARCKQQHLSSSMPATDVSSVSTEAYFLDTLHPLADATSPTWQTHALLQGIISSSGISAEPLLQASRTALASILSSIPIAHLETILTLFTTILQSLLANSNSTNLQHPALELLSFLLEVRIPQRLLSHPNGGTFKWRTLLSTVQKSHHKSNDIPKILACLRIYRSLAEIPTIRREVLKKLLGMLRTNPYPRVRVGVAEALFVVMEGREEVLRERDWAAPVKMHAGVIGEMEGRCLA